MNNQIHAGRNAKSGGSLWHSNFKADDKLLYWTGDWYYRTPKQLFQECQTTMRDLLRNHPEIAD